MDIRVSGHQLDVGAALTTHAETRLGDMAEKFSVGVTGATATLAPGPHEHEFDCSIVIQLSQGLVMKSNAKVHGEARAAFDSAADKIEKQLRRYKRRLKDRHEQADHALREEVAAYTVFAGSEQDSANDDEEASDAPAIVAETRTDIPETSVSDAVMMLDLRDTPALFFKNAGTGRHNMVYRRSDGTIGWVEPSATS